MLLKDENLYYVGGIVRDEILGYSSVDTDLCYEGNAINFAKNFNIIKENPSFGTVRISLNSKEIDIASTRTETYPKKGHLPVITQIGCSLKEDLKRRDFTINAIAKRTTDNEIIDYHNGINDIQSRVLRVLHKESFIDDPSRIIRGLKFCVRFNFELDNETQCLQNHYLSSVNYDMSYHRLKKELMDAFNLNKQEVFSRFIKNKMYKLLSSDDISLPSDLPIENYTHDIRSDYLWLIWLSFFNLQKLPLTRAEKRILEYSRSINNKSTNNIPQESIIISNIRKIACV